MTCLAIAIVVAIIGGSLVWIIGLLNELDSLDFGPAVWINATDSKPPPGRIVLAHYRNALGKSRIVRAQWIAENTVESGDNDLDEVGEYNEADDTFYLPEGWWEQIDNWDDYSQVWMHHNVTHWTYMPLPPPQTSYLLPPFGAPPV